MSTEHTCPTCGAELSASAVDGLCARCLARQFLFTLNQSETGPPQRLGDYELLEEIARGGMGVVYRARQLSLNRIVAVKVVLSGPFSSRELVRRFQTEAEAVASLRHPNIVPVYEVGERDGTHFLSMEYIEGQSFANLVRDQPLPTRRAANYLQTIAQAVQHAHECGVLHRDLKPSNVLLDIFDQPRITDFGLAKFQHRDEDLTLPGQILGSPNFIPPEQAAGKFSEMGAAADVYSLGAILYHLLTGRPPFQEETLHKILLQVQNAEPVPPRQLNPGVPSDLQTICLKCLQKEPSRRYPTARALADDLGCFLAGQPIQARPVSRAEKVWLWCKRRPTLAVFIIAFHLALAGGLAGILLEWQRARAHAHGEMELRLAAEKNAAETRQHLYAADVALAAQVVLQQGDFGRARRTLEQLKPALGERDLRGFEWRYLWNLCCGNQLAILGRHEWIVTCVAFSPNGQKIATGGMGGQVKIWDVEKHTCLHSQVVCTGAVWSLTFTPDNQELIVGSTGGIQERDENLTLLPAQYPGRIAAVSQDGALLAAAESSPFYFDPGGVVTLWNRRTGERLHTFEEPGHTLALSPDGRWLAVAAENTGIHLYATDTGKLLARLPTAKPVWSLAFSPDGAELLSAGWSGEVTLWSTATNTIARSFSANYLNIWNASFSPDGKKIVTTSSDQTIRFWDHTTLVQQKILRGHESEVWCAAFSPDGRQLVTGGKDQNVMLWNTAGPGELPEIPDANAESGVISPDGTQLITVVPDHPGTYELWSLTNHARLAATPANRHNLVGFSRNSQQLLALSADERNLEFWSSTGAAPNLTIALQNLPEGPTESVFYGLSPDQEYYFAIAPSGLIRVWQVTTGALWGQCQGPLPPIRNAVLSRKGHYLAVSIEREKTVTLFDLRTGKKSTLEGHHDFACGLAFSPDNAWLATGSVDGNIRLWGTKTGAAVCVLPGHLQETTDVAFSPDGLTLASIGQRESLKLWHLPTRRELISLPLPYAGRHLQFSPDGKHLLVNTDEEKLLILDAP